MVNHTVKKPMEILYDVLVKVESFIFLVDFVILDCKVDYEVPIILGRPFLANGQALVDLVLVKINFRFNEEHVAFNIYQSMNQSKGVCVISMIEVVDEDAHEVSVNERLRVQALAAVIMNFYNEGIDEYDDIVRALIGKNANTYVPKKFDLDLKNKVQCRLQFRI